VKLKDGDILYRPGLTHEIYNLSNGHDHNELTRLDNMSLSFFFPYSLPN